jgi:hypothetical protein
MEQQQQQEVEAAVARLAAINAQIAELTQQGNALKSFIRLVLGPGTHAAGEMRVSVITRRVFDPDLAMTVVPQQYRPLVLVTKQYVDPGLAKKVLPEETYSACCKETQAQVRIA